MIETITIISKSELRVSKNKRTYFTIGDEKDRTFVCFKPALHSELDIGKAYPVDFDEPKQEGDSYRLSDIVTKASPTTERQQPEPKQLTREQFDDLRAERIERAVWWKEAGECIRAKVFTKDTPEGFAARATYFAEMFRVLNIKVSKTS